MAVSNFPIVWGSPSVSTLSGNSFPEVLALTAIDMEVLTFIHTGDVDSAYEGQAWIDPDVIGADTITAVSFICMIMANATTGNVRMGLDYAIVGDAESMNPGSLTAATQQTIAVPGTAYLRKDVTFSSLSGTFSADDLVTIELKRLASNTTEDTLAANLHVLKSAVLSVTHS